MSFTKPFEFKKIAGEPIQVGERTVVPVIQFAAVRLLGGGPGGGGGVVFARARPIALIERGPEGERRIRIPDPTLTILLLLFSLGFSLWFVLYRVREGIKHG